MTSLFTVLSCGIDATKEGAESQRAMISANVVTMKQGGMRDPERANLPFREGDTSIAEAAKQLGVSPRLVKMAKALKREAAPKPLPRASIGASSSPADPAKLQRSRMPSRGHTGAGYRGADGLAGVWEPGTLAPLCEALRCVPAFPDW